MNRPSSSPSIIGCPSESIRVHQSPYALLLVLTLTLRLLLLTWYTHSGVLPLAPDEAQYWTWSHALDWGYYSKPLGIAWQINFGTLLFGDTELGVRAGSLLLGTLLPIAIYRMARSSGVTALTSFWAAIIAAFSPIGTLATLLAITDVGMVIAWTLACYAPLCALRGKTPTTDYLWVGLFIAIGALFKWPSYILWLLILGAMPFYRELRRGPLWQGIALSLLALIPSIIWNAEHGWMTFRHVGATVTGRESHYNGNPVEFVIAQLLLLSPLLFTMLVAALVTLWRRRKEIAKPLVFSGLATASLLLFFTAAAALTKMQGNWCSFAYPLAFLTVAWYGCQWLPSPLGIRLLYSGVALAITITAMGLISPLLPLPKSLQLFKNNLGWHAIAPALYDVRYNPTRDFLFADSYQTASLLSFYSPGQRRAYFLNLQGHRYNQFDLWPSIADERMGDSGIFAVVSQGKEPLSGYEKLLAPYFESVISLGSYPLVTFRGTATKELYLFRCTAYNGKLPPPPSSY